MSDTYADRLYSFLWRCAELDEKEQGVDARRRLASLHDNDAARTLEEQLDFTELWLALRRRLLERWRVTAHSVAADFEPVFVSQLDHLRETTSYRAYTMHQASLLARRWMLHVYREELEPHIVPGRRHIRLLALVATDGAGVYMRLMDATQRVIRCLYDAGQEGWVEPCFDAEGQFNLEKLRWLRDERLTSVRLLCFLLAGLYHLLRSSVADAIQVWHAGAGVAKTALSEEHHRVRLTRDAAELRFDDVVLLSMRVSSLLLRADQQPKKAPRVAWMLRWAANTVLGCDEAHISARPPSSKYIADDDDSSTGEDDDADNAEEMTDWTEEAQRAINTAKPVPVFSPEMARAFQRGDFDKHSEHRGRTMQRLVVTSQHVQPTRTPTPSAGATAPAAAAVHQGQ